MMMSMDNSTTCSQLPSSSSSPSSHMHSDGHTHNHGESFGFGFYSWFEEVASSKTSLPPTLLGVLCLAFFAEGLAALHTRLMVRPLFWISSRCVTLTMHNILATLVHSARMATMFFLMVVFMSLNPWLCSAIVVGSGVGHLAFKWKLSWESEAPDKEGDDLRRHW